VAYSLKLFFSC